MAFPDFPCIIDTFDRANGGAGGNWTTGIDGGATALVINGNQLRNNSTGSFGSIYWSLHDYPADVQFHITTGAAFGTGGSLATVYARIQGAGTATYDGYAVEGSGTATNWSIKLYRIDNGVLTQLGSTAAGVGTWASGDAIGIECTGTTIRAYSREGTGGSWTQEISETDATYNASGATGLSLNVSNVTHDLEDFTGGPITPNATSASAGGTQASENLGVGTVAWNNPGNAAASDNTRSTSNSIGGSATTHHLTVKNHGFSVPAGAVIVGIRVNVEALASLTGQLAINNVSLIDSGAMIGNNLSAGQTLTGSDVVYSHFYHPQMWGGSVTVSMVNGSTFGAGFAVRNPTANARTASVDHMTVTVYYFEPSTDVTGTAAITLSAVTVDVSGAETMTGTAAITLPSVTVAASGAETFTGTAAVTLPAVTVAATGDVVSVLGSGAVVLPSVTAAASGAITITGTAAVTLPSVTVDASGTVINPITGEAAVTLSAVQVAAAGEETISGAADVTLPMVTVSASGAETMTGTATVVLPSVTVSADGLVAQNVTGTAAVVLSAVVVAASGHSDAPLEHNLVAAVLPPPPARPGVSLPTPAGRRSVAL